MNKKQPKQIPTKDIVPVVGTKYVILPDNTVARLLKSRIVHGTTRFNLIIDGDFKTISAENLREWNESRLNEQSKESTDQQS